MQARNVNFLRMRTITNIESKGVPMPRQTVSIQLEPSLTALLQRKAEDLGVSRSYVASRILEIGLPYVEDGFANLFTRLSRTSKEY